MLTLNALNTTLHKPKSQRREAELSERVTMAPVSKTPKAKKKLADPAAEAHAPSTSTDRDAPPTPAPAGKKESEAKDEGLVFGVSLDSPNDIEDDANVLAPIAKYAILGMICLMSFAIRLFAVVRYESVRLFPHAMLVPPSCILIANHPSLHFFTITR